MKKKMIISVFAIVLCIALIICTTAFAGDGFSDLPSSENLAATQLESIADSKGKASSQKAVDADTTNRVLRDGYKVIFDKRHYFDNLVL